VRGPTIKTKVTAEAPPGSISDGIRDIRSGLKQWPIWWTLSVQGIRSQYRRTYLGPWWITVQQIIFVAGLSLLFGTLMGQDLKTFVPYVAVGFITFNWMTTMMNTGATSIIANGASIKTSPGPLSLPALGSFAGGTIQFLHNALVIVGVMIVFQVPIGWPIVLAPLALIAIAVNGIALGLWLGPLVARYRDVGPIVVSLSSVLFFFTPIFWTPTDLSHQQYAWISGWNPFAYLLDFFRTPLLGAWPTRAVVLGVIIVTVVNLLVGLLHFSRTRARLAYWL
jgi:ABC-type polysaccharide/polyol phosphate export permease